MLVSCLLLLVGNPAADSRFFHFNDGRNLSGKAAVEKVVSDVCKTASVSITKESCRKLVPGDELSNVCYVESSLGYWFVSKNMLDGYNLVFNRWD